MTAIDLSDKRNRVMIRHTQLKRTPVRKQKKTTVAKASEHQIQTAIIQYLRMRGWYVMRLNTGKYSVGQGRNARFIMGQEKGTPDLMCFRKMDRKINGILLSLPLAELFFIEVKREGKEPTLPQVMKMNELEAYGGNCLVAHSVEEVQNAGL
jgi:hypothetical protein